MDKGGVLTNLKSHNGLWGCKNYPLTQAEAEVVIEALEEQEPIVVQPPFVYIEDMAGGQCECGQRVINTDNFCRNCGKPLDWSKRERV